MKKLIPLCALVMLLAGGCVYYPYSYDSYYPYNGSYAYPYFGYQGYYYPYGYFYPDIGLNFGFYSHGGHYHYGGGHYGGGHYHHR